ncbi:MAG: hypothetical protein HOW73_25165 [Polyangiaceae bacterium]|nr:hypothetical protein [Polyangiaceae bacterium]
MKRASIWAVALSSLFAARPALADLADDAAKIEAALTAGGLELARKETLFVEEGHVVAVPETTGGKCRSVIVTAARNVTFSAVTGSAQDDADDLIAALQAPRSERRFESTAGVLQLSGCGGEIARVYLRMTSARGALEVRVAHGDAVAEDVTDAIGRSAGPSAPRGEVGPLLSVSSLADRRQRADAAARADGATNVLAIEGRAEANGLGLVKIKAVDGCHRFHVMADATDNDGRVDLDAELRVEGGGATIVRDRGEAPDARLDVCVGSTTEIPIVFSGAPPKSRVLVLDALFPLPKGIPDHFGDRAQAGLAAAVRKRLRRGPDTAPIFETTGAHGSMTTSIPTEPGRCYVAALGVMRGTPRGMRLFVQTSPRSATEEVPPGTDSAAVSFCASTSDGARLRVDAPGLGVGWVLSLWLLGASK